MADREWRGACGSLLLHFLPPHVRRPWTVEFGSVRPEAVKDGDVLKSVSLSADPSISGADWAELAKLLRGLGQAGRANWYVYNAKTAQSKGNSGVHRSAGFFRHGYCFRELAVLRWPDPE
jgi:hypothetical protein